MDNEDELAQFKRIIMAIIVFLMTMYFSYQEMKYVIWSTTAEATVTRTFETAESAGRFRRRELLAIEYTFTDEDGQSHNEREDIPLDHPAPGERITVEYIPGVEDSSRIEGYSSLIPIWIFLGCCAWLGYEFFKLYREANEPVSRHRRR